MVILEMKVQTNNQTTFQILTLGQFLIKHDEKVLSESARRSNKLWELLKFFITNRGKQIPLDVIVETLWPEQENADPKAALHDLTFRLRRLFDKEFPPGEKPFRIEYMQGCYSFNLGTNCALDLDQFLSLSRQAAQLEPGDPAQAIDCYTRAIALYKGAFLPESLHRQWLLPARYYYRRIYLNNVLQLMKLYQSGHNYREIESLCETAFLVDDFVEEETIHLQYLAALAENGKIGTALAHYEFLTSVLYREAGIKPSSAMRDLYRQLKSDTETLDTDLDSIWGKLKEQQALDGPLLCDREFFHLLYRLDMRRSERKGRINPLGLLTLNRRDFGRLDQKKRDEAMACLKNVLFANLRRGDALCPWNQAQLLVLFTDLDSEHADQVLKRIKRDFAAKCRDKNVALRGQIQSILPWS